MQWNENLNAGFTTGKPWNKVHPDYASINVEAQNKEPDSILNFYRKLIWIRKKNIALRQGKYRENPDSPKGVFSFFRETNEETLLVVLNFTDKKRRLSFNRINMDKRKIILAEPKTEHNLFRGKWINIAPYGVLILKFIIHNYNFK